MEIRHLRIFLDVAQRGSFAAVARDRGLDPSSVSRTVAALEKELGFGLFDRTTRHLAPTEAGEAYRRRIEPLIDDLEGAAERAAASAHAPRGTLRVLAPVSFAQRNVVPLLPRFLRRYPHLRIDLQLSDRTLDLVEHRIDVAIRLGPLIDSSALARRLAPMKARVCASPAYLDAHGPVDRPEDLRGHPCLLLDMPGFGDRWRFRDQDGNATDVDVSGPLSTSNAMALREVALRGTGVILQAEWIVGPDLAAGTLVDLFPHHDVTASRFDNAMWTLRPARAHEPAKVRVFLDYLHERLAIDPPWRASDGAHR